VILNEHEKAVVVSALNEAIRDRTDLAAAYQNKGPVARDAMLAVEQYRALLFRLTGSRLTCADRQLHSATEVSLDQLRKTGGAS
jgi:hypothetical protein